MGGAAALDWALSYPHAVRAVVAIDSVGYSGNFAIGPWLVPPLDGLAVAFWRQRKLQAQFWAERTGVLDPAALEVLRCFSLPLAMPGWHEALRRFTRSGGYTHLAPHIPQLSQPALIVWGEQDRTLGDAERFHRAITGAQLARIPGAGHAPHLDPPKPLPAPSRRLRDRWQRLVQPALEPACHLGAAQLAHGLALDLADALAREIEHGAYLLERVGLCGVEAVAQRDNIFFALG